METTQPPSLPTFHIRGNHSQTGESPLPGLLTLSPELVRLHSEAETTLNTNNTGRAFPLRAAGIQGLRLSL